MPEEKEDEIVIRLSDVAKLLVDKGVPAIRKFIEDLRSRDRKKFEEAMREAGIEVL